MALYGVGYDEKVVVEHHGGGGGGGGDGISIGQ